MDDDEPKVRCSEVRRPECPTLAGPKWTVRHQNGDACLACPNTWEEQRRWPLLPEGGAVRIGRASSAGLS
jgi:hypothetical protein